MRQRNRTIDDAECADITRDGTQVRIVRRHKPDSPLETVHSVETLDGEQPRDLRDSLTEAIDRA